MNDTPEPAADEFANAEAEVVREWRAEIVRDAIVAALTEVSSMGVNQALRDRALIVGREQKLRSDPKTYERRGSG